MRLIEVLKGFYALYDEVQTDFKNNSNISSDKEKNISKILRKFKEKIQKMI